MKDMEIPVKDLMRKLTLTVRITGMEQFRVRMAIARLLFRAGASLMGCGIELIEKEQDDGQQ